MRKIRSTHLFGLRKRGNGSRSLAALLICFAIFSSGVVVKAQTVVDEIVTLVNNAMITRSDLLWSIALDPDAPSPEGGVSTDLLRQKLEVMIDQRLIAQEANRLPAAQVTTDEVSKAKAQLIAKFRSEAEFRKRVESVGLAQSKIDELIRERIAIDKFVDFRFRSFVFVSDQDIQKYYDERLVPEVRKQGQVPPAIGLVHDQIQDVLRQQSVNEAIDRFLKEAREHADIIQVVEL
ncbi:MAG TPA: hypothetical protein VI756_09855 [Blastocatellia bacterium]